MSKKALSALACGIALLFATHSQAGVIENFESFTTGTDIGGVGGWTKFTGTSIVYPDAGNSLVPPAYPVLEGTKSVYAYGLYAHGWGAGNSALVGDGSILSTLIRTETDLAYGQNWFMFANNAADGSTPGGIILDDASDTFMLYGQGGNTSTSLTYTSATTYLLELELDFTHSTFDAYVTDVQNAGARTFIGTRVFSGVVDLAATQASGGVFLGKFDGSAGMYDDIQINAIPEPTSIGLLGLAGAALLRRRSH